MIITIVVTSYELFLIRAEEALIFAKNAKLAFENGNLQRKREILNTLGSLPAEASAQAGNRLICA